MSATTLPLGLNRSIMPGSRLLRTYLTEARYESLRALRAPAFAIPFLTLPPALYFLFGVLLGSSMSQANPDVAKVLFVNFAVFGVMGPGMFGFGMFVATERTQGLLTLKRALPMPTASYLVAKMLMTIVFSAIIMASVTLVAWLWGHTGLTFVQFLEIAVIYMLGSLPFCAVGLFIGSWASGKSAPAFVNLAYLPMMHLGGLFYPLPKSVQWLELLSPAYYLARLGRKVVRAPSLDQLATGATGHGSALTCVLVLAGVTLAFAFLAIRKLQGQRGARSLARAA